MEIKASSPSGPWGISVRTPKRSIMKVVVRKEGESLRDCLIRTKSVAKALKEKYHGRDGLIIEVISRKKAFPKPDNVTIKHNQLWCPYCAKPRQFKKNQLIEFDGISFISGDRRCVVCQMSDNDFEVKMQNHLWSLK